MTNTDSKNTPVMEGSAVTPALIEQLKRDNPDAELNHLSARIDGELFEMIARTPSGGEYDRFREQRSSDEPALKVGASKALLSNVRMWPEPAEYAALIKAKPGLVETFIGEVMEAAGISRAVTRKKL